MQLIEKDYVLGWLLFTISKTKYLVFKGETALARLYFLRTWRLSRGLDFAFPGDDFDFITQNIEASLLEIRRLSGIGFTIKSRFSNPHYLQLTIRYEPVLGRNWVKIDATKETPEDKSKLLSIGRAYADYPVFEIGTESLEEIFAEKVRALLERKKSKDFYDAWRLLETDDDRRKLKSLFTKKYQAKGMDPQAITSIMHEEDEKSLGFYWKRALGRLVTPLPSLDLVLKELQQKLNDFL